MEENPILDNQDFEPEINVLDMGTVVYGVTDPEFCGVITGILLDSNNCVTYRVRDKFYYATELTTDTRNTKRVEGFGK